MGEPQPPPLPDSASIAERAVTDERLRLLAIGYYISGALGAAFVSVLLIHFFLFAGISFLPVSAFDSPAHPPSSGMVPIQSAPAPSAPAASSGAPPLIIFRVVAGVIGLVILSGWTLGGLTIYAGRCIARRRNRSLVMVMGAINCIWVPYGTLLGIATFATLCTAGAKREFGAAG